MCCVAGNAPFKQSQTSAHALVGQRAWQNHTKAQRPPALRAGPLAPKVALGGGEEGAGGVPARARSSAIARLSLRLQTSAALRSAALRRSMLKGMSVADVSRASHLAHTELSARRSVGPPWV